MVRENDILCGEISDIDDFGRGIFKYNGFVIFVRGAIFNDVCKFKVIKVYKSYAEAVVVEFIKKSDKRIDSVCKYSDVCGGCSLSNISYDNECLYKKRKVENILSKMLKRDICLNNFYKTKEYGYRNKITFHVCNGKLGFFKEGSKSLVEVDKCMLASSKINDLIGDLKKILKGNCINEFIIKSNGVNLMLIVKGSCERSCLTKLSGFDVIYLNDELITKDDYILTNIYNKCFRLSKDSFFQINSLGEKKIMDIIVNYVKSNNFNSCLDLYCGRGTIGIMVSDYVKSVLGVEIVSDAICDANYNKDLNKCLNVDFKLGDVDVLNEGGIFDLVIVDPPREGVSKKVIQRIMSSNVKSLVYVSCNPVTLGRDLSMLLDKYEICEINVVDMFPRTKHVECVALLQKKTF